MTESRGNHRFSNLELAGQDRGAAKATASPRVQAAAPRQPVAEPLAGPFGTVVKDADHYLRQAVRLQKAGDHEKALRSYSAALGENPILHEAWLGQVLMLIDLGELREARMWADKALEGFPDEPQILAAKSIAMMRMGIAQEALELNDLALTKQGEAALTWLARGEIMLATSAQAAHECFERALRLARLGERALMLMRTGQSCARAGRHAQAAERLQLAVREDGTAAWSWYQLGLAQEKLGQVDRAQGSFGRARELQPQHPAYKPSATRPPRGVAALKLRLRNWWNNL